MKDIDFYGIYKIKNKGKFINFVSTVFCLIKKVRVF